MEGLSSIGIAFSSLKSRFDNNKHTQLPPVVARAQLACCWSRGTTSQIPTLFWGQYGRRRDPFGGVLVQESRQGREFCPHPGLHQQGRSTNADGAMARREGRGLKFCVFLRTLACGEHFHAAQEPSAFGSLARLGLGPQLWGLTSHMQVMMCL